MGCTILFGQPFHFSERTKNNYVLTSNFSVALMFPTKVAIKKHKW